MQEALCGLRHLSSRLRENPRLRQAAGCGPTRFGFWKISRCLSVYRFLLPCCGQCVCICKQICMNGCMYVQKVAECTLSSLGPQRSRWQSFPHGTAQCKYSTSDSSPGSPYCRVHIPHALHCKRTGCLQRQHSEGNAQQTVAGAFHALNDQGGTVSARLCAR